MIKYMPAEQIGVINLGSTIFFLLRKSIRFSGAQHVINQYKKRSLLKVKNHVFPAIIDAPTVIIFKHICPDLVLIQEPLDLRSNAFPLSYPGMWKHLV